VVAESVLLVEGAGVLAVQVAHTEVEVRLRRLDDQVVVRSHQAVGMEPPEVAACDAPQQVQEEAAVIVLAKEERTAIPDGRDVVVGAGNQLSVRAAHPPTVAPCRGRNALPAPFVTPL